jgi:site-specific recombinase XerD
LKEIDLFLDHLKEQDITEGTLNNYRVALVGFGDWFQANTGQSRPAMITPLDVRQFRDTLKATYKPGTINKKLNYLSVWFRWLAEEGHIAGDPAGGVKPVSEIRQAPKWLTRPQTYALLRVVQQEVQLAQIKKLDFSLLIATRTRAMIILLLNTGLRVSEACDLKVSDIELREKSGLVTVRWGKGAKRRQIPLNLDARKALQDWIGIRPSESDYLFCTPDGRMTRQLVQWHCSELGKQLGFKLTPHLLRHTFGKSLVDQGVSLDRVAALMGHSNINTTAIYTMPSRGDLEKAVETISWET